MFGCLTILAGETILVDRVSGGDPDLRAEAAKTFKVRLQIDPWEDKNASFSIEYLNTKVDDAVGALPAATAQLRAALPERFSVGADGVLSAFDDRAINFERTTKSQLRSGFNYRHAIQRSRSGGPQSRDRSRSSADAKKPNNARGQQLGAQLRGTQPSDAQPGGTQPNGAQSKGAPPRGAAGRGRGGRPGRIIFSLYHVWQFEDRAVIASDVEPLDFLNGAASGVFGGAPEHKIDAGLRYFNKGRGARLSFEWQSGSVVSGVSAADDLSFSSLSLLDLRLFQDFSRRQKIVRDNPWLDGARVTIEVENLLNDRLNVSGIDGMTPERFVQDQIDPFGRTLSIRFRKLFR